MDKLSQLINQARPLYRQRKRRKTIAKLVFIITMPVFVIGNIASLYIEGDKVYTSLENNNLQKELLNDDFDFVEFQ